MERRLTMIMGARRGELARVFVAVFVAVAMMLSMTAGIILPAQTVLAAEQSQDGNDGGGGEGGPPVDEDGGDPEQGSEPGNGNGDEAPQGEPDDEPGQGDEPEQGGDPGQGSEPGNGNGNDDGAPQDEPNDENNSGEEGGSEEPTFGVMNFGGGGSGTLVIKKYGDPVLDGEVLVGGATFKIQRRDCFLIFCDWVDYKTVTDNEDPDEDPTPGVIRLSNLPSDDYKIVETHAPEGYEPGDSKEVTINANAEKTVNIYNLSEDRPIIIIKKYGDEKIDGPEVLVGGATFKIQRRDCFLIFCDWVDYKTVTDNEDPDEDPTPGVIRLSNLPSDDYRIVEIVAPEGYEPVDDDKEFHLRSNDIKTVEFYNDRDIDRPAILIEKYGDNQLLGGATFEICEQQGNSWGNCFQVKDNEDDRDKDARPGIVLIDGLNRKKYKVTEIQAPDGWIAVDKPQVSSKLGRNDVEKLTFHNEREPEADLGVEKEVDNATPYVGDEVTFTITVTNHGPDDATDVVVTDLLPAGLEYVSHDSDGAYDETTGEWDVGDLDSGESVELRITVKVTGPAGETITNVAEILTSEPGDENGQNDSASASVTPQALPEADLGIEKEVDNATPHVGDQVTFTITVTNHGPDDATDVVVTDLLPAGLEYVSHDSDGAYDETTGQWNVGDLADGESAELKITAKVTGAAGETITNVAEILTSEPGDENGQNDSASASVTPIADGTIVVEKVDQHDEPVEGAQFVLEPCPFAQCVAETNENGIATFTDVPPGKYTVREVSAPEGYVADPDEQEVAVNNDGSVNPQQPLKFVNERLEILVVKHMLPEGPLQGATFVLKDAQGSVVDQGVTDENGDLILYPPAPGEYTVEEVDTPDGFVLPPEDSRAVSIVITVDQDGKVVYTPDNRVIARNEPGWGVVRIEKYGDDGQTPLAGATFEICIQPILSFYDPECVMITDNAGEEGLGEGEWHDANSEDGIIEYSAPFGDVQVTEIEAPAGWQRDDVPQSGRLDEESPDGYLTFRFVNRPEDTPRRSSSGPRVDLAVTKTVDNPAPEESQQVTFTVTVTNEGPDDASGVVVSDILPAGLEYVSHNASQGTYDPATGQWQVGNLADDASATLTVVAIVSPGTGGQTLVNTARVVSSNPSDSDAGNNSASADVTPPQLVLIEEEEPAAGPGAGEAPPLPVTGGMAATMLVIPGILSFAAGLYLRRRFF